MFKLNLLLKLIKKEKKDMGKQIDIYLEPWMQEQVKQVLGSKYQRVITK